jgi:PAS domain-containing protein
MEEPLDAYAHEEAEPAAGHALARAEELVATASQRLRDQDERLASLYRLVECLMELGPPVTVVEGSVVRAWSDALERLTGVRRASALGARLNRVLPTLSAGEDGPGRWTAPDGAEWTVAVRPAGPELQVLWWMQRVCAPDEPLSVLA